MGWVVNATPRPLYPRKRPGTHCTGGWVDPRAGLDGWGKISPPPEFDPRTVQPVTSRYTDWAIPAHCSTEGSPFFNTFARHTDTYFTFSREFKISVAAQIRYLHLQTFTNNHCHFLIPAQSVTSVLLQRHKPKRVRHENCGCRPTANVLDYRALSLSAFLSLCLSLSLPFSLSLSLSSKTRPCDERLESRAPKIHAACAQDGQNVQNDGHEH